MGGGLSDDVRRLANGVVLPLLGVGGREWEDASIDCNDDVAIEQYDDFAFAIGAWRNAGGCDYRADGVDASAV